MQNLDTWEKYSAAIERDEIPLGRAYRPTDEERMIREFVLQLKRGALQPDYFTEKYGVDVLERFSERPGLAAVLRLPRPGRPQRDRAHARRVVARRRAAAALLPAAARRDSVHLDAVGLPPQPGT